MTAKTPEYKQHPTALKLMPAGMNEEDFAAFCADITERGLIYDIVLHDGMVLDGWHRYRACLRTSTPPRFKEYTGKDPAGYVAACNVLRRRLSSLQRALVGARIHLDHAVSQRDVCKRYSISNTALSMVLKVLESRNAVLIKRVETDAEYTRGQLREDLSDAGLVHENYGRSKEKGIPDDDAEILFKPVAPPPTPSIANSVFAVGALSSDTIGNDEPDDEDDDLIGGPLPDTGKRRVDPAKRRRTTPAQHAQEQFAEMLSDLNEEDKHTFLQMIWPTIRPLAEELKLPGMGKAKAAPKANLKAA